MTFHVPNQFRITTGLYGSDDSYGNQGAFEFRKGYTRYYALASDGEGWEHVSVSVRDELVEPNRRRKHLQTWKNRLPTWEDMCAIKTLFWDPEDCVIQFHPPRSEYVNCHPTTLHLWRPVGRNIETPPYYLVGPIPTIKENQA